MKRDSCLVPRCRRPPSITIGDGDDAKECCCEHWIELCRYTCPSCKGNTTLDEAINQSTCLDCRNVGAVPSSMVVRPRKAQAAATVNTTIDPSPTLADVRPSFRERIRDELKGGSR